MSSLSLRGVRIVGTLGALATVFILLTGFRQVVAYDDAARQLATQSARHDSTIEPSTEPPPSVPPPATSTASNSSPTPTTASSPSKTSQPTPIGAGAVLLDLLDQVEVIATRPNPPGYERDCGPGEGCVFGTDWSDATDAPDSRNGCDTRNDVLRRDLETTLIDPETNGCVVLTGVLHDPYTGATINFERGWETSIAVQIDHLIPLAAAWDLGAWSWSPAKRATFSNDTQYELLAVDGSANMSKSDSTPASWLPPNKAFRCEYGIRYLRASLYWGLPITAADAEVLGHVARACD